MPSTPRQAPTPPKKPSKKTRPPGGSSNARLLYESNDKTRENESLLSHRHTAIEELLLSGDEQLTQADKDSVARKKATSKRRASYFQESTEANPAAMQLSTSRRGSKVVKLEEVSRVDSKKSLTAMNGEEMSEGVRAKRSSIGFNKAAKKGLMNRNSIVDTNIINDRAEKELIKRLSMSAGGAGGDQASERSDERRL